jgi:hypothetical protein
LRQETGERDKMMEGIEKWEKIYHFSSCLDATKMRNENINLFFLKKLNRP